MTEPFARPTAAPEATDAAIRLPRAFVPAKINILETEEPQFDLPPPLPETIPPRLGKGMGFFGRLAWGAGGLLVSLGLGLWADGLVRELFSRYEWLGWAGAAALALFILAVIVLAGREIFALRRLRALDRLRSRAAAVLLSDRVDDGRAVLGELASIYHPRADLARARETLQENAGSLFDGSEIVRFSERTLMSPLDARAKILIAASARRVAVVTAISPRALVDIAFVAYESARLARAIAELYGARPGLFGFLRLAGSVLGSLAITGGLAMGDGVVEQLVGQGLAARISARLGEGLVNGLMTVRVGIAAMRVVRPLPFDTLPQPLVRDFAGELIKITQGKGLGPG